MTNPQADRLQAALWIAAGLGLLLLLENLSPILLALPVSAALLARPREAHQVYDASSSYRGSE